MYTFSKKKFLSLSPATQASKLSLLLKAYLESSAQEQELLDEYRQYVSWLGSPCLPLTTQDLYNQYHAWNQVSGFNRGLLRPKAGKDRQRALRKPIAWRAAVDTLRSGYNVGSIIRTADAFGFSGVILGGASPSHTNRALQSAAMGAETWVPLFPAPDLGTFLEQECSSQNVQLVGLELSPKASPLEDFSFSTKGILVVGNEETGIAPRIRNLCHHLVKISLFGRKHSLNVASAFAIAAHHLRGTAPNQFQ